MHSIACVALRFSVAALHWARIGGTGRKVSTVNLLPNQCIKSFWGALRLSIQRFGVGGEKRREWLLTEFQRGAIN